MADVVEQLDVTLGEVTTRVQVVSHDPIRWSTEGTEAGVPVEVLRHVFEQARAAGVRESRIMSPRLTGYTADGQECEVPRAYHAWCIYAR